MELKTNPSSDFDISDFSDVDWATSMKDKESVSEIVSINFAYYFKPLTRILFSLCSDVYLI